MSRDFNDLLRQAEQLSAKIDGSEELPRVERSLRQVLDASQELWSKVATTGSQDIHANLLLGTKGVDLPQLTQKLETLSSRKTFEPLQPIADSDIQNFLKNESENAIISLIESTHHKTFERLHDRHRKKVRQEWHAEKLKLMNSLLGYSKHVIDLPVRQEKSVLNESVFGAKSCLDQQEMAYAQCIIEYNQAVIEGTVRPNLIKSFSNVATNFNDQKVGELWNIVDSMTQLPPQLMGNPLEARTSPNMVEALIHQARTYLENRYKQYMSSIIACNMTAAKRGGVPGTYSLVRGYVAVRVPAGMLGLDSTHVEGQPLWPLIYYCLRCGSISAALQCAQQAGPGMEEMCQVLDELKSSSVHRLSPKMEKLVRTQYRRAVRNTTDPYKRAVFCILGACDVNDEHSEVAKTADDYLWMKLCQVRESTENTDSGDQISYSVLQSLVLEEYGEKHYNANDQPHVYFQLLFLTGQWEAAIDFLVRSDRLRVHGVHMAIALQELNLLAMPASVKSPLLVIDPKDAVPMRRINLVRLILIYVQKFESHNAREALHYFYCLRSLKTPTNDSMFVECVSDLVMETREFDAILGRLGADGYRLPGLIDAFNGTEDNITAIIDRVAATAEKRGQYEDAITLYDLAGVHEKVLSLMSTLLCQVVAKPDNEPGSLRSRLSMYAENISERYSGIQLNCSAETAATFYTLRDLIVFFNQFSNQQYHLALETIQKSHLIPLSNDEVEERVNKFPRLVEEICKIIPDIMLATMNILYSQYMQLRGASQAQGHLQDQSREKQMNFLRERARAITSFAGTVPYRLPGDTNSRLVEMEILMH
ncbi:hypothetical protein LSTR_LSTR002792 [Laodelphax striatellus]|uniref:Nuclear pore protein n=1 Tax=Laodelphax striatellus TaxID=195883 RepID=A0A482XIL4_LAOST|nr:hypothetical protein LSTR_LSTR002792 [Laodelphax striatellus]